MNYLGKRVRHLMALSMVSLFVALAPQAQANSFSELIVFGDSLSDSGNVFDLFGGLFGPSAPYTEGRFTSPYTNGDPGLVWVEHLAGLMGLPLDNSLAMPDGGTNYAFGGAEAINDASQLVPSLPDQRDFYLTDTGGSASASALYLVFGGGNDVRANTAGTEAAESIGDVITSLYDVGARNFFVPNLPDIGMTPESQAGEAPGSSDPAVISAATVAHNDELAAQIAALQLAFADAAFFTFDIYGLFNAILANPAAFGLTNVSDACAGLDLMTACSDPDSFLFFDGIHPTAITHEMMGMLAFEELQAIPVPAALPLLLSALGFLGWRFRRA